MAVRSHTETFLLIRNKSSKHRNLFRDYDNDDERVTLVNGNGHDNVSIDSETLDTESSQPNWFSAVDEFRYESNKINSKVDNLREIQEEHLKRKASSIFADDGESAADQSYEIEIEFKCQEINKLFNRLHYLMTQMKSLSEQNPNSRILKNVFQWEVKEVSDLTVKFRSCQRKYLNQRNERDSIDKDFVITFEYDAPLQSYSHKAKQQYDYASIDSAVNGDDDSDVTFFQDFRLQKKSLYDSETLKLRDEEMTSIVKSISELNQIFHDVNTLVINQGTLLDRIDYNLESVQHTVTASVDILRKAEKSMRNARKMKLILILSGIVMLMILYLIIFKA